MLWLITLLFISSISCKILHTDVWGEGTLEKYRRGTEDKVVTDPTDPSRKVIEVLYEKGKIGGGSGFGFKASIENLPNTVCLSYSIFFEENFPWTKEGTMTSFGGKLPGLMGGVPDYQWTRCSGGRRPEEHDGNCFTTRFMWRKAGAAEVYGYIPTPTDEQCVDMVGSCARDYGYSIQRGGFYFKKNQWNRVAQEVSLNDIGQRNGYIKAWYGEGSYDLPDIDFENAEIRTREETKIRGYSFSTFFGGGSPSWAPPFDTHAWFSDVTLSDSCADILSPPSPPPPSPPPPPPPSPPPPPPPSPPPPSPPPPPPTTGTSRLAVVGLETIMGRQGGKLESINVEELTDNETDNNKMVTFNPAPEERYEGIFTFELEEGINPLDVTGLTLNWNYRGPARKHTVWQFYLEGKDGHRTWAEDNRGVEHWRWSTKSKKINMRTWKMDQLFDGNLLKIALRSQWGYPKNMKIDFLHLDATFSSPSASKSGNRDDDDNDVDNNDDHDEDYDDDEDHNGLASWEVGIIALGSIVCALVFVFLIVVVVKGKQSNVETF